MKAELFGGPLDGQVMAIESAPDEINVPFKVMPILDWESVKSPDEIPAPQVSIVTYDKIPDIPIGAIQVYKYQVRKHKDV